MQSEHRWFQLTRRHGHPGDEFFIIQAGEADVEVNGKKAISPCLK